MTELNRSCGSCSLCCRVMGVPGVKPDHEWCQHALSAKTGAKGTLVPGGGCKIYAHRPEACRAFSCMWLLDEKIKDYWYPLKSRIVINVVLGPPKTVGFVVDPSYPNRWREEPWFSDIKRMAQAGIDGRIGEKWTTVVMIKDERIPIIGRERLLRAAG
jgi:hypothetical protein